MTATANSSKLPHFIVTVDAEGDDLWARPQTVTTENARFLPRFQDLCERHGWRPTYLATYEMALCPEFRIFARRLVRMGRGEIGMHLHAWNSPPDVPLTGQDFWYQPPLTHYSEEVMRQKVVSLTRILEQTFDVPIRSHRGGRWSFNATYAQILAACGYWVDSSVTPHVSWRRRSDNPFEREGPDYSGFPESPYFLDLQDISREGMSFLLEVPVTVCKIPCEHTARVERPPYFVRWLRPNGRNLESLLWIAKRILAEQSDCLVLMLHSSELMPGGSPLFRQPEQVEALYRDLDVLFDALSGSVRGHTLTELYLELRGSRRREPDSDA